MIKRSLGDEGNVVAIQLQSVQLRQMLERIFLNSSQQIVRYIPETINLHNNISFHISRQLL